MGFDCTRRLDKCRGEYGVDMVMTPYQARYVAIAVMLIIIVALDLAAQHACAASGTLPDDPLQRAAAKALRGDFGPLKPWQREGYLRARRLGTRVQGTAWVTSYYPQEGFPAGRETRSGRGVSIRSAACARWRWPQWRGKYVWTAAYGLRLVEDTGANHNERVARRKGAAIWLDYWFPTIRRQCVITDYAIWR